MRNGHEHFWGCQFRLPYFLNFFFIFYLFFLFICTIFWLVWREEYVGGVALKMFLCEHFGKWEGEECNIAI